MNAERLNEIREHALARVCPACLGAGFFEYSPSDQLIDCSACKGTGYAVVTIKLLRADIVDLLAEVDRLAERGWQPIETAPTEDGFSVLGGFSRGEYKWVQPIRWNERRQGWINLWDKAVRPTHWMHLPEPPGVDRE